MYIQYTICISDRRIQQTFATSGLLRLHFFNQAFFSKQYMIIHTMSYIREYIGMWTLSTSVSCTVHSTSVSQRNCKLQYKQSIKTVHVLAVQSPTDTKAIVCTVVHASYICQRTICKQLRTAVFLYQTMHLRQYHSQLVCVCYNAAHTLARYVAALTS